MGLFLPAQTPRPIVNRIHAAAVEGLRTPHVRTVLGQFQRRSDGNTPDEFAKGFRQEIGKWTKVIKRPARNSNSEEKT